MIRESDIDLAARRLIIRNAKAGNDISLPITGEIAFALAMAINAPPQTITMKGLRGMKPGEVRVIERKKLHHEIVSPRSCFPGRSSSRPSLRSPGLGQRASAYVP